MKNVLGNSRSTEGKRLRGFSKGHQDSIDMREKREKIQMNTQERKRY